jgi:hypothetical protein
MMMLFGIWLLFVFGKDALGHGVERLGSCAWVGCEGVKGSFIMTELQAYFA